MAAAISARSVNMYRNQIELRQARNSGKIMQQMTFKNASKSLTRQK